MDNEVFEMARKPAPWATMEDTEDGHGCGEGAPQPPPESEGWSVFEWDMYDLNTLLHELIMMHYTMISFTELLHRSIKNRGVHDEVMQLLQHGLDDLEQIRSDLNEGMLF